jgi:hypothetical protein
MDTKLSNGEEILIAPMATNLWPHDSEGRVRMREFQRQVTGLTTARIRNAQSPIFDELWIPQLLLEPQQFDYGRGRDRVPPWIPDLAGN